MSGGRWMLSEKPTLSTAIAHLSYGGNSIGSHSSPCFQWLDAHAADYGLINYPVEPWHWSTTGN